MFVEQEAPEEEAADDMNEYGTYKTVKASFWPWCKTVKARFLPCLSYKWFPLRSEADLVTEPRGVVFVEQEAPEEEAANDILVGAYPRCRANTAHTQQSRPDSGLGLQVKALKTF